MWSESAAGGQNFGYFGSSEPKIPSQNLLQTPQVSDPPLRFTRFCLKGGGHLLVYVLISFRVVSGKNESGVMVVLIGGMAGEN